MDAVALKLDSKFRVWKPAMARSVRARVKEIIASADTDTLDLMRSRSVEQEVLNLLDEPASR